MAAGAASIWRNRVVPVAGAIEQVVERPRDGLAEFGTGIARRIGINVLAQRTMRNGHVHRRA